MRLALASLAAATLLIAALFWFAPVPRFAWPEPPPPKATAPSRALERHRVARALGFSEALAAPPHRAVVPPAIKLLGTMVAAAEGWSLALTEDSTRHARTLTLDSVVDDWRVVGIAHGRLELEAADGRRVTLETGGASGPRLASAPGDIVLRRPQLLDEVQRDLPLILSTTRIDPVLEAGALTAFALHFPVSSPLTRLGLRPGDVLRTLDGRPVTPQLALEYSSRWQSLGRVEAGIERAGRPLKLAVRVE